MSSLIGLVTSSRAQQEDDERALAGELLASRQARRGAFRDAKVLAAVRDGIGWLVAHQSADGRFDADGFVALDPEKDRCDGAGDATYDIGVTGLALLVLTAQADRLHVEAVQRAADWLSAQQNQRGALDNGIHEFVYGHAIAVQALAEAWTMTANERHLAAAMRGCACLSRHRRSGGAWRYEAKDPTSDSSVTTWCLAAEAACRRVGIEVLVDDVAEPLAWLDEVSSELDGHCGYTKRWEISARLSTDHQRRFPPHLGETLSAAALHVRLLLGADPASEPTRQAVGLLAGCPPEWDAAKTDLYYWYHGSQALHLAAAPAGKAWLKALQQELLAHQRQDGASRGSWDPVDVWGEAGGRVASTALALLSLQAAWRLQPAAVPADVPADVTFRALRNAWQRGRMDEAQRQLGLLEAGELTPRQRRTLANAQWSFELATALADATIARAQHATAPDYVLAAARLPMLAEAFGTTATGVAARDALAAIRGDDWRRTEFESATQLLALCRRLHPGEPRNGKALRSELRALREACRNTQAAVEAGDLATRMAR